MATHAKRGGRLAAFVQWAAAAIAAVLVFGIGCVAGYQAQDSFGQVPFWIIYGGNQDPGDGHGNGAARDQLVAGGWTTYDNSYQVQWTANIPSNKNQVNEAMPAGHAAVDKFCGHGCIIAGFSWGTAPALQLTAETGTPPANNYVFGGPQHSTGVWHNPYLDNPFVEPWFNYFGPFWTDRPIPAGTQVFFDTRDPYANAAPQCGGPGLWFLNLNGHRIVGRGEAYQHVWVGRFGEVIHEVGYQPGPWGLPRSGSDPQQPWDFCPPNFPSFQIPARNGDPGVPVLPGVPTR